MVEHPLSTDTIGSMLDVVLCALQIEALDEDNARVVVKLTIGQQLVTVTQSAVRLVSKKEYEKYSKYISK